MRTESQSVRFFFVFFCARLTLCSAWHTQLVRWMLVGLAAPAIRWHDQFTGPMHAGWSTGPSPRSRTTCTGVPAAAACCSRGTRASPHGSGLVPAPSTAGRMRAPGWQTRCSRTRTTTTFRCRSVSGAWAELLLHFEGSLSAHPSCGAAPARLPARLPACPPARICPHVVPYRDRRQLTTRYRGCVHRPGTSWPSGSTKHGSTKHGALTQMRQPSRFRQQPPERCSPMCWRSGACRATNPNRCHEPQSLPAVTPYLTNTLMPMLVFPVSARLAGARARIPAHRPQHRRPSGRFSPPRSVMTQRVRRPAKAP